MGGLSCSTPTPGSSPLTAALRGRRHHLSLHLRHDFHDFVGRASDLRAGRLLFLSKASTSGMYISVICTRPKTPFLLFKNGQADNQRGTANENTDFSFSRRRDFFFSRGRLRLTPLQRIFGSSGVGVLTGCSGARDGGPSGPPISYVGLLSTTGQPVDRSASPIIKSLVCL